MIYELRTYGIKPGSVGEYYKRFEAALAVRLEYSAFGGMWHTDVGPINQLIHIWPYESLQHRADTRKRLFAEGRWNPNNLDLLVSQEVDILDPVASMEPWGEPKRWGDLYELRMYTYAPGGDINKAAAAFNEALPGRSAIYPVAGMFTTQQGNLNRLYQLFPYKSWDHREEVRAEFRKQGVWPPHAEVRPINQLVRFLEPAPFSPIH